MPWHKQRWASELERVHQGQIEPFAIEYQPKAVLVLDGEGHGTERSSDEPQTFSGRYALSTQLHRKAWPPSHASQYCHTREASDDEQQDEPMGFKYGRHA